MKNALRTLNEAMKQGIATLRFLDDLLARRVVVSDIRLQKIVYWIHWQHEEDNKLDEEILYSLAVACQFSVLFSQRIDDDDYSPRRKKPSTAQSTHTQRRERSRGGE